MNRRVEVRRTTLKPIEPPCRMRQSCRGPLAQLGERLVRNQEVGGSIPPRSTNKISDLQSRLKGIPEDFG
jgi:hypothetical protein